MYINKHFGWVWAGPLASLQPIEAKVLKAMLLIATAKRCTDSGLTKWLANVY